MRYEAQSQPRQQRHQNEPGRFREWNESRDRSRREEHDHEQRDVKSLSFIPSQRRKYRRGNREE
jgi:hypothetical protein